MLLHLLRAGGAVEPEHINREGLQDGDNSRNIRSHQHRAGGFHRHRHHQGTPLAAAAEGLLNALQGRLDLQHVLAGFDDEQIHIAGNQAFGLLAIGLLEDIKAHMPQGGQFGRGTHGARHKAGFLWGAEGIGHLPGQFRRQLVEGEGLVFEAVFGQHNGSGTKGVGFDHIATHLQELAMDRLNHIGAGHHQVLVAAL